jgi:hypothetical protein
MILPESWAAVLSVFGPVFARRGTFRLFTVLATGMVVATGRRSVVGMLAVAGMARRVSFHAACRFFSHAVWDVDRLGLAAAGLIVRSLLGPDEPVAVAVDGTLFKRWGRKVHCAFWTHDGSAQGKNKVGRGNRWIIAGIVVRRCQRRCQPHHVLADSCPAQPRRSSVGLRPSLRAEPLTQTS